MNVGYLKYQGVIIRKEVVIILLICSIRYLIVLQKLLKNNWQMVKELFYRQILILTKKCHLKKLSYKWHCLYLSNSMTHSDVFI